jgi:hypothetical protein
MGNTAAAMNLVCLSVVPGYAWLLSRLCFFSEVELTVTGMASQHLALWLPARQDSLTNGQHVPPLPPS